MIKHPWYLSGYRTGLFHRAQRVKWATFAGVCCELDTKRYWTYNGALLRVLELNRIEAAIHGGEA